MLMSHEIYVKRTLYIAKCDCGEHDERTNTNNPPKEKLCGCGKWVQFLEHSYIRPELVKQSK
jgi:hypothetical protein